MPTIRDYIDLRAKEQPDRIYMLAPEPGYSLTYRQLQENSACLGKYFIKLGLSKGDTVSFMLGNGYWKEWGHVFIPHSQFNSVKNEDLTPMGSFGRHKFISTVL